MSRLRDRVTLTARIRREFNLRGQTHYPTADLNATLDTEYAWCWEWLSENGPDNFGVYTASLPTVAAQSWVALPADFSDLGGMRELRRLVGGRYEQVERSSRKRENDLDPLGQNRKVPGVYWIEGPSVGTPSASRLELRPVPGGIENLEITYVQQAPLFANDGTTLDVWSEHVERLLCAMVAAKATASGDMTNYNKVQQQMAVALGNLGQMRGKRDSNEPNWVHLHQRSRGWGGVVW